jgi:hypothetical protein
MGAVATLTLTDDNAGTVDFEPTRLDSSLVTYHEKSSGVFLGYPSLTLGNRLPTNGNGNYKATARLRIPVLETAATAASGFTPGPTLAYSLSANVDVVIPSRATAEERSLLAAQIAELLTETAWLDLVEGMELPY